MPPEIAVEPAKIFQIVQYTDEVGRRVLMKSTLEGEPVEYLGQATGRIEFPNRPPDQWMYTIKIDAANITEAFANFDKAIKEQWPAMLAERRSYLAQMQAAAKRRIVVAQPGQGPAGAHA